MRLAAKCSETQSFYVPRVDRIYHTASGFNFETEHHLPDYDTRSQPFSIEQVVHLDLRDGIHDL